MSNGIWPRSQRLREGIAVLELLEGIEARQFGRREERGEAGHGGKRQEACNLTVDPCSDVQRIFRAVLLQILPMVSRRLNERERSLILPGNVYVWEERRESDGESSDNAPDN